MGSDADRKEMGVRPEMTIYEILRGMISQLVMITKRISQKIRGIFEEKSRNHYNIVKGIRRFPPLKTLPPAPTKEIPGKTEGAGLVHRYSLVRATTSWPRKPPIPMSFFPKEGMKL